MHHSLFLPFCVFDNQAILNLCCSNVLNCFYVKCVCVCFVTNFNSSFVFHIYWHSLVIIEFVKFKDKKCNMIFIVLEYKNNWIWLCYFYMQSNFEPRGLHDSPECCRPRRGLNPRPPTGDQEVAGPTPAEVGNILSWRLIMKYFLRSFSTFRWFKKGSCQFLAKECAQYWLTA